MSSVKWKDTHNNNKTFFEFPSIFAAHQIISNGKMDFERTKANIDNYNDIYCVDAGKWCVKKIPANKFSQLWVHQISLINIIA